MWSQVLEKWGRLLALVCGHYGCCRLVGEFGASRHSTCCLYTHWSDLKGASGPECDHFRVGKHREA